MKKQIITNDNLDSFINSLSVFYSKSPEDIKESLENTVDCICEFEDITFDNIKEVILIDEASLLLTNAFIENLVIVVNDSSDDSEILLMPLELYQALKENLSYIEQFFKSQKNSTHVVSLDFDYVAFTITFNFNNDCYYCYYPKNPEQSFFDSNI